MLDNRRYSRCHERGVTVPHLDRWVIGAMTAIVGLFGLYLASQAQDSMMYFVGLVVFAGAVLFNFFQINKIFSAKKSG